jgi:hypothetical protein
MSKTPWMKGPWWVEKRDGRWQIQTAHGGPGSSFCIAAVNQWTYGAEETGRLLAAAPELAEALQEVMECFGPGTMTDSTFEKACAALRKAKGETP